MNSKMSCHLDIPALLRPVSVAHYVLSLYTSTPSLFSLRSSDVQVISQSTIANSNISGYRFTYFHIIFVCFILPQCFGSGTKSVATNKQRYLLKNWYQPLADKYQCLHSDCTVRRIGLYSVSTLTVQCIYSDCILSPF